MGSLYLAHNAYTLQHLHETALLSVLDIAICNNRHVEVLTWNEMTYLFARLLMKLFRVIAYTQPRPTTSYSFLKTSTFVMTLSPGRMP